jgi:hypothetical protein
MRAHRQRVHVASDHRITVELPEDFPEGPAEILIQPANAAPQSDTFPAGASLAALLQNDEFTALRRFLQQHEIPLATLQAQIDDAIARLPTS